MDPASPVLWFAVRAIAARAGGRALAAWALEEVEAEQARRLAEEARRLAEEARWQATMTELHGGGQ